jgi:NAD(P)-dependent dehydrogenase (short-subunit alcohol dehydrogenase family)
LIHVTSIVGRLLFPGCAFYCASKFAHEAYAEVLHYELTGTGVESVIVKPGPYRSRLLPNSPAPADLQRLAGYGELAGLRDRFVKHFEELEEIFGVAPLLGAAADRQTNDLSDLFKGNCASENCQE